VVYAVPDFIRCQLFANSVIRFYHVVQIFGLYFLMEYQGTTPLVFDFYYGTFSPIGLCLYDIWNGWISQLWDN